MRVRVQRCAWLAAWFVVAFGGGMFLQQHSQEPQPSPPPMGQADERRPDVSGSQNANPGNEGRIRVRDTALANGAEAVGRPVASRAPSLPTDGRGLLAGRGHRVRSAHARGATRQTGVLPLEGNAFAVVVMVSTKVHHIRCLARSLLRSDLPRGTQLILSHDQRLPAIEATVDTLRER